MSLSSLKHDLTTCIMHQLFHNASCCVLSDGAPWRAELSSSCFIELCMGKTKRKKHKCKSLISAKKKKIKWKKITRLQLAEGREFFFLLMNLSSVTTSGCWWSLKQERQQFRNASLEKMRKSGRQYQKADYESIFITSLLAGYFSIS